MQTQALNLRRRVANNFLLVALAATLAWAGPMASGATYLVTNIWTYFIGFPDAPWVGTGTDGTVRGLAHNPVTDHLLVVSRTGGNNVHILNGNDGAYQGTLPYDSSIIAGGTFPINLIGVGDDGAIYVCNLVTSGTNSATPFKVYRWASEDPNGVPTVAYVGDPGAGNNQRWGDTFDVRGGGANTQIIVGSRNGTQVALLTTANGTDFTARFVGTDAAAGSFFPGLALGEANVFYSKTAAGNLRRYSIGATGATTGLQISAVAGAGGVIGVDSARKLVGIVNTASHIFSVYDFSDTATVFQQDLNKPFPSANANNNGTGAVDFGGNKVFALDSNNGIMAFKFVDVPGGLPPIITVQPGNVTVLEKTATVNLNVSVSGTPPFRYQWQFNSNNIAGATNTTLTLTNVTPAMSGLYHVVITNVAGSSTSSAALFNVNALVTNSILSQTWRVGPTGRTWLSATDNNQRGLSYNAVSNSLLVVSRTGGNNVWVVDANTGADKGKLFIDTALITGGTFGLNLVGAADDGAIYACNLVTTADTVSFKIYRWPSEDTNAIPDLSYADEPAVAAGLNKERWGDSFAVRGAGANTQILAASRATNLVALFTTADGVNFSASIISVPDAESANFSQGLAFGAGNTFWGKGVANSLRHVSFDPATGQGTTLAVFGATNFPAATTAIAVDTENKVLAALAIEAPDNIRLYDISVAGTLSAIRDVEFFGTDNANGNFAGALDFGGGKLFALDTNNGLLGLTHNPAAGGAQPVLRVTRQGGNVIVTWTEGGTLQSSATVNSGFVDESGAGSVTHPIGGSAKFYRVRK